MCITKVRPNSCRFSHQSFIIHHMFSIKGPLYFNTQQSVCSCCTVQFLAQFTIRLCATDKISRSACARVCFPQFFTTFPLYITLSQHSQTMWQLLQASLSHSQVWSNQSDKTPDFSKLSLRPLTRPWIHYRCLVFIFQPVLSCLVQECHHTCFL